LIVALLSIGFLNEKVGIRRWLSIFVGLIGVLIALNPSGEGFFSLGALACVFGVLGYSVVVILIKKMSITESTFAMVFYFLVSLTLGCGLISIFDWNPLQPQHWPVLVALGISGSIGQYFITEAFRIAPVSVVAPLDYSALVWGTLFGYVIWSEVPGLHVWVGAAIIIFSGIYLMVRESKQKRLAEVREFK
jgi:drug/metabolite transporter (DMT)-like permease